MTSRSDAALARFRAWRDPEKRTIVTRVLLTRYEMDLSFERALERINGARNVVGPATLAKIERAIGGDAPFHGGRAGVWRSEGSCGLSIEDRERLLRKLDAAVAKADKADVAGKGRR